MNGPYFKLSIWATDMLSDIWVGDEEGNLVCKDVGWLNEGLEAGTYVVQIGSLKAPKHYIELTEDFQINENELNGKRGKIMTRRRRIRQASQILAKTWIIVALAIVVFLATQSVRAAEGTCRSAENSVMCVTKNIQVGDELSTVLGVLGMPVSTFEGIACPPGATPGDDRCITNRVSVHIIGDLEFIVAYGAGVVQSVDVRPVPEAHKPLLESMENPFR